MLILFVFDKRIREALPLRRTAAFAAVLLIAVWGMYQRVPGDYRAMAAYHVVFSDLLLNAQDQPSVLRELGLPPEMTTFRGTDAFSPQSGMNDQRYRGILLKQLSHFKLLGYYLRHPDAPLRLTGKALRESAFERHLGHGNFTQTAGKPPSALSHSFAVLSDTRRALFENRPLLYAAYLLAIGVALLALTRGSIAALVLVAMAGLEFFLSAFADVMETSRHLFLFRALMDLALITLVYQLFHRSQKTP
jgi:hypothetical protein